MTEQIDAVVTGGGSGIGRAVALALARRGLSVMVVGRQREPLRETCQLAGRGVSAVDADITEPDGRQAVVSALPGKASLRCLVHNAGVLEPVGALATVTCDQWRYNMAVNVDAPLFLTQALLDRLPGGRVLNISSGAAHRAIPGWGAYCTAKAGLYMLQQCLQAEFGERDILFGSVRPGVVDTDMQALIRAQSERDFPQVDRFRALAREGRLHAPEEVADFIVWLLLDCAADEFPGKEWEIDDHDHRRRWLAAE